MRTSRNIHRWIVWVWAIQHCSAQTTAIKKDYSKIDPREHMCELALHASSLDGSTLYIHGGYVTYDLENDKKSRIVEPNAYLRIVDFSQSFSLSSRNAAPVEFRTPPAPVPELAQQALWAHNGLLLEFSGRPEGADKSYPGWNDLVRGGNELWKYDIQKDDWGGILSLEDSEGREWSAGASALKTVVPGLGLGVHLGGYTTAEDDPQRSLSIYDFNKDEWRRYLTEFEDAHDGQLVHVPVGPRGILVWIGGVRTKGGIEADPMSTIEIFNLNAGDDDGAWASPQPATSTSSSGFPLPRKHLCAWAVAAPDASSFQIYMYGGLNAADMATNAYKDLWVLSLPSFEWILVDDGTDGPAGKEYSQTHPGMREGHTCHLVGKSVAVMVGGRVLPDHSRRCETTGLYAYDLNEGGWVERFEVEKAGREYKVPEKVFKIIGGDGNGGSSKMPKGDLADSKLKALFVAAKDGVDSSGGSDSKDSKNSKNSKDTKSTDKTNPSSDSNNNSGPDSPASRDESAPKPPPLPLIIGVAVGGAVLLALALTAAILCILRRRRKARYSAQAQSTSDRRQSSGSTTKETGEYYSWKPDAELQGYNEPRSEMAGESKVRAEMDGDVQQRAEMDAGPRSAELPATEAGSGSILIQYRPSKGL